MLQDREINGLLFYYDEAKDECILPSLTNATVLVISKHADGYAYRAEFIFPASDDEISERVVTATITDRFFEVPDVVQSLRNKGLMERLGFERADR